MAGYFSTEFIFFNKDFDDLTTESSENFDDLDKELDKPISLDEVESHFGSNSISKVFPAIPRSHSLTILSVLFILIPLTNFFVIFSLLSQLPNLYKNPCNSPHLTRWTLKLYKSLC